MREAFIKLHISTLLAGFTGLFGKLVALGQFPLTWFRVALAALVITIVLYAQGSIRKIPLRSFVRIAGVGVMLSLHWLFFYASIKASNISIGVVCYALVGFFTAIFEPLANHRRFSPHELCFSLLTVLGITLIFHFDSRYRFGIMLGVVSSAIAALFMVCSRKVRLMYDYPSRTIVQYCLIGGAAGFTVIQAVYSLLRPDEPVLPSLSDFIWLLLLASFCTVLLQLFQVEALKRISAFTVNLTYNLEPIYSIAFAMLFFGEAKELNFAFYVGLALIFLSVGLQTYTVWLQERRNRQSDAAAPNC